MSKVVDRALLSLFVGIDISKEKFDACCIGRLRMEPSSMRYIEFQGKTIEVDEEGFLKSDKDWSEELANYLSKEDGIELSKDHWEIINFVRWYYITYQNSPHPRFIIKKAPDTHQN